MHKNTMASYAERLSESVLTSLSTSVTAFLSQNRWLCERPEVGQTATWNRAVHPRQWPASFPHPVTPQQCVWSFFDATGKWNSSQVGSDWHLRGPWAEEGRGSTKVEIYKSGNGVKKKRWPCSWETKVLPSSQMQQKLVVETLGSYFQREHAFGCSSRARLVSVGHLSLPTRITKGHWPRRRVSATLDWSCSPTAPSHLVPWARLMEKCSDAFPCIYRNGTGPLPYFP